MLFYSEGVYYKLLSDIFISLDFLKDSLNLSAAGVVVNVLSMLVILVRVVISFSPELDY